MKRFLSIIILLFFALSSFAQSFKVIPASIEFKLSKGELKSEKISVTNTSDRQESFVISTCDYTFDDKGNTKYASAGTYDRSCANWMTVTPSYIQLNPNENIDLSVIMKVPDGEEKTHWGMVIIRSEKEFTGQAADKDVVRAGLIITPQIAVKVLQTPPGLDYKKLSVDNFYETTNITSDSLRNFAIDISNQGDILTKCKVYLTLSNLETLSEQTIAPQDVYLLPEISKEIKLSLPKDIQPGAYSLAAIVDYGDEYDLEGMEMEITISPKN
ncbi:hypothetical protein [Ancylomarina longa]|uniref:DUF3324 domain-containing protein n=1 Tax=Ancylomarina longa TaxID=2487017 RepID=A0A434AGZ1_9BACT|nr:hypothetical protein [Ancylomarina longa]RUT73652.1 hypothetical protein DLK05_12565 [Ancylomarina longa]